VLGEGCASFDRFYSTLTLPKSRKSRSPGKGTMILGPSFISESHKKGTGKNDLNTEKCQDRKMPKYSLPIVRAIALGSQVKL
jgi:hypothetical protein